MLIGIFNTMNEALQFLRGKEVAVGSRIIILGGDQTTHEYQEGGWKNINGIYLVGEKGQSGLDGKAGRDAKEVDTGTLFNQLYEKLKLDEGFAKKVKGEKGEKGDRGEKGKTGTPGETPDSNKIINAIYEKLKNDQEFIKSLKGKEGYTPVKDKDYFDGKNGENGKTPIPGEDFPIPLDGLDGTRRVLIENTNDIKLEKGERGIDFQKNIYIERNGSILKI